MRCHEGFIFEVGGRRYVDGGEVGGGGLATVYSAVDKETGEVVAVKFYDPGLDDSEVGLFLENSVRTHELLGASQRFPKLHCIGQDSYVMDFIDGTNLCEFSQITEQEALAITYGLAACLVEFHGCRSENPIVHRDIKPSNLIIGKNGRVHLADFDLAYIDEQSVDGTDRQIGTPEFLSPEQIKGTPVLPISDLFSVGSTLFNLFTGNFVWEAEDYIRSEDVETNTRTALVDFDGGSIKEVIAACWRLDGSYKNAEHMADELADRLRVVGVDPERSNEILVGLVKKSA